ncbi:hypothetical protein QTP88_026885 [Uroleucon formosanum]
MDSARTARYLLAVATVAVTISLSCAAPMFGVTISIPKKPDDSASSSLLEKFSLPQLPKITVNFNSENTHSPQPSEADDQTSPDNKKQELQPEPTVDEQPGRQDSHQSSENASQVTSPKPKLETTTDDRSISDVPQDASVMYKAPKDD